MLTRLKVINFLLIKELELEFSSGLTVITGETGSGKSIIIDALMLIFGEKAVQEIVRKGSTQASLEAEFILTNRDLIKLLHEHDLSNSDDEHSLLCRRVIDHKGKNKIYVNGYSVTLAQARQIGEYILDIHTQHASITLLKHEMQRKLLDEYSGITEKVILLGTIYKDIKSLEEQLKCAVVSQVENEEFRQLIDECVADLNGLNLQPGEWDDLQRRHRQLINTKEVIHRLTEVLDLLQRNDNSIFKQLGRMSTRLDKLADCFEGYQLNAEILTSVEIELREISHNIVHALNNIEQDPDKLSLVEQRMNDIYNMGRKYRVMPELLLELLDKKTEQLKSMTTQVDIGQLNERLQHYKDKYLSLAKEITAVRTKSAVVLSKKITQLLKKLAISGEFKIEILNSEHYGWSGLDNIEYKICFNKGMSLQPLSKVASGGELSRTALALYLLLSTHNPPEVIVFDEIDVGISGKVAAIVGKMLHELGSAKQVICITHQPQTASYGNHHLFVSKEFYADETLALVESISGKRRVEEIARMLGGMEITPTTLIHAEEMLNVK